jgi:hypothetical protein
LITVLALAAGGWLGKSWWDSRLPGTYSAMEFGRADFGGGPGQNHAVHPHVSVDQLKGPRSSKPDFRITLVARKAEVTLGSGRTIEVTLPTS